MDPAQPNGFQVENTALRTAFAQDRTPLQPVPFRIVGDVAIFIHIMAEYGLQVRLSGSSPEHHRGRIGTVCYRLYTRPLSRERHDTKSTQYTERDS